MPTLLLFEDLIAALRRQGFVVGLDRHLRMQQLIGELGDQIAPDDLKTTLCPIFATTQAQQKLFYQTFESLYPLLSNRNSGTGSSTASTRRQQTTPMAAAKPLYWRYLLLSALALGIAVAVFWPRRIEPPVAAKPSPAGANPSPSLEPARAPMTSWLPIFSAVPFLLIAAFEIARWRKHRAVRLARTVAKTPPSTWPIRIEGVAGQLDESIIASDLPRKLSSRQTADTEMLDVDATVRATVEAAGLPSPRFRSRTRPPEYLVLIDRVSIRDHWAALFERRIQILRAEGLFVEAFTFQGDPRICRNLDTGDQIALADLRDRAREHRLLLFCDGEGLLDRVTGRPHALTELFRAWPDRALLTPLSTSDWGLRESALAKHFLIFPASLQGMLTLVEAFGKATTPPSIAEEGSPAAQDLREFLGPGGYLWLCACAVYPELHWDLTLFLGSLPSMPAGLVVEENLLNLIRLPWFRTGFIPDDIRQALIVDLGPAREAEVRHALITQIEKNPAPLESVARENQEIEIAAQRLWVNKARNQPAGGTSPQTIVALGTSPRDSILDLILPYGVQRALGMDGAVGWGAPLRVGGSLALALLAAAVTGNITRPGTVQTFVTKDSDPAGVEFHLQVSPATARVRIGELDFGTARTIKLPAGTHEIEVYGEGVVPRRLSVQVKPGMEEPPPIHADSAPMAPSPADLSPPPPGKFQVATGSVLVNINEPGFLLTLDGRPVSGLRPAGRDQYLLSGLLVGQHRLEVGKAGFRANSELLTVAENQTVKIELKLVPIGPWALQGARPGTQVVLIENGRLLATADAEGNAGGSDLPEGWHELELRLKGYHRRAGFRVNIKPGQESVISGPDLQLERIEVLLQLQGVEPRTASMAIEHTRYELKYDGPNPIRTMPAQIRLPPGTYNLTFSAPGYDSETITILLQDYPLAPKVKLRAK